MSLTGGMGVVRICSVSFILKRKFAGTQRLLARARVRRREMYTKSSYCKFFLVLLVLLLGTTSTSAQVLDRGEITGTVLDETGAALPGVTVTVTHLETGLTRVVVTNESGRYRAPLLPVGSYRIEAALAGFATLTREGVVVTVGSAPVIPLTLPLASVTEAITVTADTPIVATAQAVASTTLNQEAVATLPINGRDFRDFATLTPTATVIPGLRSAIRFGGQSGDYSMLSVDGADMTNPFFAEYTGSSEVKGLTISQEAVQEFQVLANGFAAEFGRSTGGVMNVVTKSGSNEWRGSGFIFLRDSALQSEDPFGFKSEDFSQQQFGGSIGGPIARDKAFFFFAADIQDLDDTVFTRFTRDVSGVAVPQLGISDLADLEGATPEKTDIKSIFAKVDVDVSQNNRISARLNFSENNSNSFTGRGQNVVAGAGGGLDGSYNNFENFRDTAWSVVASLTSVIGTRAFNEFKFHYSTEDRPREALSDLPESQILDTGSYGRRFFLPITGINNRIQITDSFSYLFGNHDLKFGVDWNRVGLLDNAFIGWSAGTFFFDTLEQVQAGTPTGLAQRFFLNGFTPDDHVTPDYYTNELGLFIQDKWQVNPNLTVSYGVRFEGQWNGDPKFPIVGIDGQVPSTRQAPGTDLMPVPQTIANDTNNWGPRLGVSWDPGGDGRSVVRGSAGLYYGRTAQIFMPASGGGFQSAPAFLFPAPLPFPQLLPAIIPEGEQAPSTFSIGFVGDDFNNPRVLNTNIGYEREVAENLALGFDFVYTRTENGRVGGGSAAFNSFDQNTFSATGVDEFGRPTGVDSGFTDSDGDGVILRRPDGTIAIADILSSLGWARYKAFTVSAKKAFTQGVQFQAFYTWSRDEGNADSERDSDVFFGISNPNPAGPALEQDFGIDERDITHRFIFQGTAEVGAGFTVSGIVQMQSGRAAPAYTLTDVNGDEIQSGGINFDHAVLNGELLPRFPFRQPNFYNVDLRVMWSGNMGNAGEIDLLFEMFNLFNFENLESRIWHVELANFGEPTTFAGNPLTAQFGVRYRFPGR